VGEIEESRIVSILDMPPASRPPRAGDEFHHALRDALGEELRRGTRDDLDHLRAVNAHHAHPAVQDRAHLVLLDFED